MRMVSLLLLCSLLMGCAQEPSRIQDELDLGQYTKAVDQSIRQDPMDDAARLMVRLETQFASYRFDDTIITARMIEQLPLTQDNPVRLRAKSIQLSAEAMIDRLTQATGTYQIERSILDDGQEEKTFPATGQLKVSFGKPQTLLATVQYQQFGTTDALRSDTETVRFEPDLSARLSFSEGLVSYVFSRAGLTLTFEGPGGKRIYQLKKAD
ncbi:hypothetical protein [Exiguobacterium artemiae]|uniref:hypothetical protein n=1 Tax=Exiguobacterium artemiae TaxID=340145 RepID=UPI003D0568F1